MIYQLNFPPSYHLVPVHFLHSAIMASYYKCTYFRFLQVLFRYIGSLHMYFVMRVCWFVCCRYCCGFRSMSLKSRLSNSKLHYYFLVPYFGF